MTREQESDSTISPEKEEGGVKTPSPQRLEGRQGYQRPLHGGYVPQPVVTPREVMCSFCGGNTHDYRDCPVMQQYIREQADALAQRRLGEYQHLQDWERHEVPRQFPPPQDPLSRGESQIIEDQHLVRDSLNKEFKNRGGQPGRE